MGKLTAIAVSAAIKAGKQASLVDGEGLRLVIDKAARSYWVFRARINGKDIERSLGRGDKVTLADARSAARNLRADLESQASADRASPATMTFAAFAEQHITVVAQTLSNKKHAAQWQSTIDTYINPHFGSKPISEVSEGDITKAVVPIWLDKNETASRVLQRVRAILNAAKGHGLRDTVIDWDAVRFALPKSRKAVRHMPSVPFADAPAFYSRIDASASAPAIRAALRFLMLTALRPGNVNGLRREWIDGNTLIIPAEDMKARSAFRCPLSAEALRQIELAASSSMSACSAGAAYGEYVFGGLSGDTLRMMMRRLDTTATPHGFRSTFKEWALANGYPDHLSELQLAHVDDNKTRRAYARDDQLELRRSMIDAYAKFLTAN